MDKRRSRIDSEPVGSTREDHQAAVRFAVASVRSARTGNRVPPPRIEGRRYSTMQGELTARSLMVAAARREEGEGPDPEDPDGAEAYAFVERVAK